MQFCAHLAPDPGAVTAQIPVPPDIQNCKPALPMVRPLPKEMSKIFHPLGFRR